MKDNSVVVFVQNPARVLSKFRFVSAISQANQSWLAKLSAIISALSIEAASFAEVCERTITCLIVAIVNKG